MESWQTALVLVILIITIWNFIRFGLGHKNGALDSYGIRLMVDNDVDVAVSSAGLLLAGMVLGVSGTYANFSRELVNSLSSLKSRQT